MTKALPQPSNETGDKKGGPKGPPVCVSAESEDCHAYGNYRSYLDSRPARTKSHYSTIPSILKAVFFMKLKKKDVVPTISGS